MSLFGDGVKSLISKIDQMREEYFAMSANFKNLERSFDRFVSQSENRIEKLSKENEDMRRRITELEGIVNATFKNSVKEALTVALRDYLKDNGDGEVSETVKKLLGVASVTEETVNENLK